jgi:PrtD family type I secretion system ABC transporter
MRHFLKSYRQVLFQAGVISFCINLLLLAPTLYMIQVFDRVFTSRSTETLVWLTMITVAMLGLYWVMDWIRARLLASVGALLDRLLSEPVMRRVMEDAARPTGGGLMFLARDVGVLRNFFGGPGIVAILDSPWLPFFVVLIFFFHPLLGAMAVVATAVLAGIALANFRLTQAAVEDIQDSTRRAGRFLDIGSRNAEVVMALGMNDAVVRRWGHYNRKALRMQNSVAEKTAWLVGGSRFARQLIQVVMLAAGAYLVIAQHVTPGVMLAVTLILGRALAPVEQLIANWKLIGEARAAYRRLDEVMSRPDPATTRVPLPRLRGELSFDRVTFGIRPGQPPIIKGISFGIAPGQFLGVIGPTGSGKSTLVRLMAGVWRAQAGSVRIDGAEVSQWDPKTLGRQIGYLPQDIELFPGTVAENIARMGKVSGKAVIAAARAAGVHELILGLPKGYATDVGANGENLSGGQRQRIALARALYGMPRLLVLDEPNSNLDAEGERALFAVLDRLKQAKISVVMVCHKPSLLARADRLLVLKDGVIAGFGTRDQVLANLMPAKVIAMGARRERA